jgi:hypothetical protein
LYISLPTTKLQVPSVEWLHAEDATEAAKALRNSKPLRRAALKYAQATNRVPFFNQPPASAPARPVLNFFGRTVREEEEATREQAAGAGATGAGEQAAGAGQAQSQGPRPSSSRRSREAHRRRGSSSQGDPEEEDREVARACSMCDRLRNATAHAVVLAHTLLGDPQVPLPWILLHCVL